MPSLLLPYALACQATYDASAVAAFQDEAKVVHVFASEIDGTHCLAFEGTHDFEEWIVDLVCVEVPMFGHAQLGPVHLGMMRDVLAVYRSIMDFLAAAGWPPYDITGHSKGGGEALLLSGVMKQQGHPPRKVVALEAPRIGTGIMRDYVADLDIEQTATQNAHGKDLVTQVPFGPSYVDMREPLPLIVPDALSIPQKHEISAVVTAIAALP